jgi:hypothetical protein
MAFDDFDFLLQNYAPLVRWIPLESGQRIPVDDIAIMIAVAVALRT